MKNLIDTHTHTIFSGHAYSTLIENVVSAKEKGLKMMVVTDHGISMPGGPHMFYFGNLKSIPRVIMGVEVLRGVEANIIDYDGTLDMKGLILKELDVVIASLHDVCIKPINKEKNTEAVINVMNNKYVDILGHLGNPAFEIDIDAVVRKAKEKNILIEINNSSLSTSRVGSYGNCFEIAKKAKEIGANLVIGSDAHICFNIGNFDKAEELIKKVGIPDMQIMNTSVERFKKYLFYKGKIQDMKKQLFD